MILAALITGGLILSRSYLPTNQSSNPTPTPTVTPTPTNTPTPEEVDLSLYSLQIQNGSGIAGEANEVADILDAEGFSSADTTNADSYDYQKTTVSVKNDLPTSIYDTIHRALNDQYDTVKDNLVSTSDYDVIIIVGQRLTSE